MVAEAEAAAEVAAAVASHGKQAVHEDGGPQGGVDEGASEVVVEGEARFWSNLICGGATSSVALMSLRTS